MTGIYKITNLINNKSYIGQSVNIEDRWVEHQRNANNPRSEKYHYPLYCAMRKYGFDKFALEILEECSQEELDTKEIKWIKFYNSFNNGYNLTMGGGGTRAYDIDAILEDYKKTNNMHETARHFSCHPGTVRNIAHAAGLFGETADARPVEKIDPKTLKVIGEYDSLASAALSVGLTDGAIRLAVSNGTHSGGYYWRDKGDETKTFQPIQRMWKTPVGQFDKTTGGKIADFPSIADAARALGKDGKNGGSSITAVCKGKKKSAFGFIWKYI